MVKDKAPVPERGGDDGDELSVLHRASSRRVYFLNEPLANLDPTTGHNRDLVLGKPWRPIREPNFVLHDHFDLVFQEFCVPKKALGQKDLQPTLPG